MVSAPSVKNVVTIGGASGVMGAALEWIENPPANYRLIIIDEKSHFNFVYAFPRACVVSGFERELFIPYNRLFPDEKIGEFVCARAIAIHPHHVELDREVPGFGKRIDFEYMIYSAGTTIPAPGRLPVNTKLEGIEMLKKYQSVIRQAESPIIIGAGAVGIELASEIKEHFPEKNVTLIHSRTRYLPRYSKSLDAMTYNILKKRGVRQVLGHRVVLPKEGFPLEVGPIEIKTVRGKTIKGDLAIMCIGMTPNSALLATLSPESLNPDTGFVRVKDTMQIADDRYPYIFAAGDVIDHTDVKTGHFAWYQGIAAYKNILKMIAGETKLDPYVSKGVALIKLILGERDAVLQTNMLGPLVTLGSWISGRSIPHNIYADAGWAWMRLPLTDETADL